MKKRILSLFLSVIIIIGTIPAKAAKAELTQYKLPTLKTEVFTTARIMGNHAYISGISQFVDNNNHIGFAYDDKNYVYIAKMKSNSKLSSTLKIKKKFPILGAVTCDEDGNYYIIWGQEDILDNGGVETIAVSKYSNKGKFIKTAAIKSDSNADLRAKDTMIPFDYGNCAVTIYDGVLVCNYARATYENYQSNAIIAVNIKDMSLNKDYFSSISHSFDQRVTAYEKADGIAIVNHGDYYDRGFCITLYGKKFSNYFLPFKFYYEDSYYDDYNLLNFTNAQLGGVGEVSTGLALVGASAKSYSPDFFDEGKQLFIQIFDPSMRDSNSYATPAKFVLKGSTRYDNNGKAVDKNVKWLTNYSDSFAENPQMVVTDDDRIVVMWERFKDRIIPAGYVDHSFQESRYMILSAEGEILQKSTSMGKVRLNAFEEPYFIGDSVYWVTADEYAGTTATLNRLKV